MAIDLRKQHSTSAAHEDRYGIMLGVFSVWLDILTVLDSASLIPTQDIIKVSYCESDFNAGYKFYNLRVTLTHGIIEVS